MPTELTTKEAAQSLDVPLGTVKHWVDHLPVPVRVDSRGARKFDEQAMEVLEQIKQLRNIDDRGLESIRVILARGQESASDQPADVQPSSGPELATGRLTANEFLADSQPSAGQMLAESPSSVEGGPAESQPALGREPADTALRFAVAQPALDADQLAERVAEAVGLAVAEAVQRETGLAEKYARAAHQIGALEERVRALEAERVRLVEQLSCPPAVVETGVVSGQLQALDAALASLSELQDREASQRMRLIGERERLSEELQEVRVREAAERERNAVERERLAGELTQARAALASLAGKETRPWWKVWG